jgi:hypothetical protein
VIKPNIPNIRRARGHRLYTESGGRLVDLWQAGGSAILGHKPRNVVRELKNVAERGLFAPYPSTEENRFVKALSELFPRAVDFHIYTDRTRLRTILEQGGVVKKNEDIPDPAILRCETPVVALWRPFCESQPPLLLIPILPWRLAPAVLVTTERGRAEDWEIPSSDFIEPILLAGATRAIYDLVAEQTNSKREYPKIKKVLTNKECIWKQNGVYLHTDLDEGAYARIFRLFLEAGCLLPPNPRAPAILPSELSGGEEAALARLLAQTAN